MKEGSSICVNGDFALEQYRLCKRAKDGFALERSVHCNEAMLFALQPRKYMVSLWLLQIPPHIGVSFQ